MTDAGMWLMGGAGSVVGAVITAIVSRSLVRAKVKNIIAETYDRLIETLSDQVKVLQGDVERLRNRLDHLTMKELQYLEQITILTKERNSLQIQLMEKEAIIDGLKKKYTNTDTT